MTGRSRQPVLSHDCEILLDRALSLGILLGQVKLAAYAESLISDDAWKQVIRKDNTLPSLPVVTIGNKEKLDEQNYRE